MTGRRDNKQAQKQWRREEDDAEENASIAYERQRALNEQQNAFNVQNAATAMQFEKSQTEAQMGFQERLSNTAHQREIKDLYAAGLNPILSGTGGMGSSSPVGASGRGVALGASGSSAPKADTPRGTVFPSAPSILAGLSAGAQIELVMAQKDKTEAEAEEVRARTPGHALHQEQTKEMTKKILADTDVAKALEGKTKEERAKIAEEINLVLAQVRETHLRGESHAQSTSTAKALEGLYGVQTRVQGVEARLQELLESSDVNALLRAIPALAPILSPLLRKK